MVLHVFISLLGGVPLCIPYGLYSGTSLGRTTRGTLEGYPGRVLSESVRTCIKGMVGDTSFMACRHSRVETAFYLECLIA